MTKKDFIKELATKQGITQVEATKQLDAFKSVIKSGLLAGEDVSLGSDFGTFKPTLREGKTPGTGKPYSSKSAKFSVSDPFKRELN